MAGLTTNRARAWSHLAANRRRPTEYEIVSTNLLYWTYDKTQPFQLDSELPMNRWFRKHVFESPLQHADWNGFRDPDALTYRTYNAMQDSQEAYVDGLLDEHDAIGYDATLGAEWLETLARLYTPARYLFHTLQMSSGYLAQVAPASTITICAALQMADSLRWVSRIAYRTAELAKHRPGHGFGRDERAYWENDAAWQGLRELMERQLVAYDWAEAFVSLNLVAKPAIDEIFLRHFSRLARASGDNLLAMLCDAQLRDSERSRRWSSALVNYAFRDAGNAAPLAAWIEKWNSLADRAIEAFCAALPDLASAAVTAKQRLREFQAQVTTV